jgi:hypothetical protein
MKKASYKERSGRISDELNHETFRKHLRTAINSLLEVSFEK